MVRSCERVGWSGGKLDLVWTSLVCIDDSAWFLEALLCCSRLFLVVIFGALSWWFSRCVFRTLHLVIWWVKFLWTLCGSFASDSLPNFWVKGLDFGLFRVLGFEVFLRLDFWFLLIEWVLGTDLLAKVAHEVPHLSPKYHFDPWNSSGDRLVEGLSFSRGLSSSRLSRPKLVWLVSQTGLTG
jgi:hypothetical protein